MKDSQQNARPKILLVDDEADFCAITALGLKKFGYDVVTASSACDALNIMRTNKPDLVLMDVSLEGQFDGIQAAEQIRSDFDTAVIYLTGHTDDFIVRQAKITEPFGYIVKPVKLGELKAAIEVVLYKAKTESELKNLNRRLEEANQKLHDFAHVVSHDLKTPLRGIRRLTEWIARDCANILTPDERKHIQQITERVDRMYSLIDKILEYSSVEDKDEDKSMVDLGELVNSVIEMLDSPENVTITIENQLPVYECNETRIAQVFQNLLGNAVKYIDKPEGRIRVGCVEEEFFWKFSVKDNGPGIEKKHFDKVFELFKTLVPPDKGGGTGIGLATVKKIVEMYGGSVWLESELGKGSTFYFSLPKREATSENEKSAATATARKQASIFKGTAI
jgi:signal transduction histidine kinase